MPFYRDHIYPHLVSMLGNPEPIREVRQRIVPLAEGTVLEIGVGPGVNFVHYDPARVKKLYALEPNPGMVRLAEKPRRRTKLNVEFLDLPGERIPLEDGSVDTVVSTLRSAPFRGSWRRYEASHVSCVQAAGSSFSNMDVPPIRTCDGGKSGGSRYSTGCSQAVT
jgi:hypothetical protein